LTGESPNSSVELASGDVIDDTDELYVGYLPTTPSQTGRFVRRVVILLALLALALPLALALLQSRFDPGIFEFGAPRTLEGRLVERPYPALLLDAPDTEEQPAAGPTIHVLLVDPGKRGAQRRVEGMAGSQVRVTGTLAARPDLAVLELDQPPQSLSATRGREDGASAPRLEVVVRGEIVDA
jgi:hypothetical protein